MGPRQEGISDWLVAGEDGKQNERIEEVNVYKYLGVQVGRSRLTTYHEETGTRTIRWREGVLKTVAKETPHMVWAADIIWRQELRPALVYGVSV